MRRNPRKLGWTKAFRKAAGKEMLVDTTLQFAARRNVPVRYDRHLWQKTLAAMSRIEDIRQKRERVFYKHRMRGNRAQRLSEARRLVADNEHLLPRLRGSEKRAMREKGIPDHEIAALEKELQTNRRVGLEAKVVGEEQPRTLKTKARDKVRLTEDGGEEVEFGGWHDEDGLDDGEGEGVDGMEIDVM